MPNQNFRGPHDDMNLVDCHLAKSYKGCQPSEKVCRFAYASWCPVCDLDANRKRSKSECTEVNFRKRGRDNMKTPSPKKSDRMKEYYTENKDFLDHRDTRLDSSRVRTNLCELPTSYITGNCQINVPSNIHEKLQQKKLYNGNSNFSDSQHNEPIRFKSYSSEIASEFSSYLHSPGLLKDDHQKSVNITNGDIKSNRVHKYINLSAKIEDNLETEYKTTFIKTNNKSNSLHVPPASKIARDIPIPHKEKISTKSKIINEVSKPPNDRSDCKSPINKPSDKEKSLTTNNTVAKRIDISKPLIANDKSKESPKKIKSRLSNIEKQPNTLTKPSSSPVCCIDLPVRSVTIERDSNLTNEVKKLPLLFNGSYSREEISSTIGDNFCNGVNVPLNSKSDNSETVEFKRQRIWQHSDSDNLIDQSDSNTEVKIAKKKSREISPTESKKERVKNPVKYSSIKNRHKLSAVKLRKVRSKIAHSVSSDSNFSDSDVSDTEEEESSEGESYKDVVPNSMNIKNGATPIPLVATVAEKPTSPNWPIRDSLFPYVPPYISFESHDSDPIVLPPGVGRFLKWRLSTITPVIVRKTLQNTGFRLVKSESNEESSDWIGCWGKHMKSVCFQTMKESQKLNHFPGTFQIGRKDRLWKNLQRLMYKYGQKEFGFIPRTYVLPQDLKLLRNAWEKTGQEKWIIKPPASARGTGIKVIHRWAHLPKKKSLVVQQYISNPYLINGSKFDLRLYVLVTSFSPLRIYLYPDGLARFASTKYSDDLNSLSDRYMHLTNYSINKLSSQYTANEDANACKGHKWTISKLWDYMETKGVNTKNLWRSLQQLVIKTVISGESSITQLYKANVTSRYNCYELFGVDVLLDERLKPWLLEVNISPSLHSASPLDLHVKGPLVKTLLNLAQFHLPSKLTRMKKSPACLNIDLYTVHLTCKERLKHVNFTEFESREEYLDEILDDLTGDDVRHLIQAEDELTVIGNFERVFPTKYTHEYLQYMEMRYYNRLFDAWETKYENNRQSGIKLLQSLCEQRLHLVVAPTPVSKDLTSEMDLSITTNPTPSEDIEALLKKPQTSPDSFRTDAA